MLIAQIKKPTSLSTNSASHQSEHKQSNDGGIHISSEDSQNDDDQLGAALVL